MRRVAPVPGGKGNDADDSAVSAVHGAGLWLIGCLIVLAGTLMLIGGPSWGAGRVNDAEPTRSRREYEPSVQA